jgi:guanylate kinase
VTAAQPEAARDAPAETASATRGRLPLVVLSGPSGVGKTTVVRMLRQAYPHVWVSVSATTRFPRPGEQNGVHYSFVTDEEFDRLVEQGAMLEWATFAGNRYGTPREPVERRLREGVPVVLEIDLQGARQVRESVPDALLVFVAPPSWEELVRRLSGRGTEPPEAVQHRLEVAREELAAEAEFDVTVVNTSVQDVCDRLVALVESVDPAKSGSQPDRRSQGGVAGSPDS